MQRIISISKYVILTLVCGITSINSAGQQSATYLQSLKTVQVKPNGVWGQPPVITKGEFVDISFDDLQHDYVRYTYKITHCDAEWNKSNIYEGDYLQGMNGAYRLGNYSQSISPEMEYNHYTLRLPNRDNQLLLSGNYKVEFFEDGDDEAVAVACFSILEPSVGIDIEVSGNTDIDTYVSHQQVSFTVNYKNYPNVNNPEAEFIPIVVQNHRWQTSVSGIKPTYIRNNELIYNFNQKLIFPAGNEYRRFEILDRRVPTMNVEKVTSEGGYYHAYLYEDKPRVNYFYDQDQNGRYYIRNNDNIENDTESDYFYTHFTLKTPKLPGGEIYLNGDFTDNSYDLYYQMDYNIIDHQYEIVLPLKQGSYNYQYVLVADDENDEVGDITLTEGNFHQTENEYYVYIYHRPFGERYDKLVGFQKHTYKGDGQ